MLIEGINLWLFVIALELKSVRLFVVVMWCYCIVRIIELIISNPTIVSELWWLTDKDNKHYCNSEICWICDSACFNNYLISQNNLHTIAKFIKKLYDYRSSTKIRIFANKMLKNETLSGRSSIRSLCSMSSISSISSNETSWKNTTSWTKEANY